MQIMSKNEAAGATTVLIDEQQGIKEYFRKIEEVETDRQKKAVGDQCLRALEVLIAMEEEIFYPSVRRTLGERQRVVQGLASNQVTKLLMKELKSLPAGEVYNTRFDLLKDNIVHHFETIGAEMFPRVDQSAIDGEKLGQDLISFKSRYSSMLPGSYNSRRFAALAAGIAAVGVGVWFMRRRSVAGR